MASGGFNVQVADFVTASPKFTGAANELNSSTTAETSALHGLGSFWGTTAHGPDFGAKYQPLAEKVLALAKLCGLALEGVGDGLQAMQKQYNLTEAQITKLIQAQMDGAGGGTGGDKK